MVIKFAILVSTFLIAQQKQILTNYHYQDQPVIGIFTQPSSIPEYNHEYYTYIATSYVKFLESGGARVIPIPYEADFSILDEIFANINGILLPGGSTYLKGPSLYTQKVAYLVDKALKINKQGGWFPIIGICLGHEVMHYILSNYSDNFLIEVTGQDKVTKPIKIENRKAYIYAQMNDELYRATLKEDIAYFHHYRAVPTRLYEEAPILQQYLKITSTQNDDNGNLFITSTDGINIPFYTFQYHPEKNPFEWTIPANHSIHAVQFSRVHSQQFVESCRMNSNKYSLDPNKLIYSYNPIQPTNKIYNQVYIFQRLKTMGELEILEQQNP